VNAVMNLRVSQNAWSFLTSWETVSFSGRTCSMELDVEIKRDTKERTHSN
jgi:hypothetical protein